MKKRDCHYVSEVALLLTCVKFYCDAAVTDTCRFKEENGDYEFFRLVFITQIR